MSLRLITTQLNGSEFTKTMDQLFRSFRKIRNRATLGVLVLAFILYVSSSQTISDLERVKLSGELSILTIPGPTTYFEDGKGKNGFDYIIANQFAESLDLTLKVNTASSLRSMLLSVGGPQGNFAAANLVTTPERNKVLEFSDPYLNITQQLIYRRGTKKPKTLMDLRGELLVIKSSSHSETLKQLKNDIPSLQWREEDGLEMNDLIKMVHAGDIDYAIVDSLAYLVSRHIYPNAGLAFNVTGTQSVSWAFPKHGDGTLVKAANKFLREYVAGGHVESLTTDMLAQSRNFSVSDSKRLGKLVDERLPQYETAFRNAGKEHNLDWLLLAAVSYQESHWNPLAKSPTGVRGLMMLTLDTAKEMEVTNRLDALQSIEGGAAYLSKIHKKLPDRIAEPDRKLLALAAYNIGFGHLEDARILTQRMGGNPDLWKDVRENLPLLSQQKHYAKAKYGYARGTEPVVYVDNIQYYYHYLNLHFQSLKGQPTENMIKSDIKASWKEDSVPSI